jgi:cystathionine beta-lyase
MAPCRIGTTVDGYLYFIDRVLDGMRAVLLELGDDLSVRQPSSVANTPYGLVTHCLGVVEYWAGALVAGRLVDRDRDKEFDATGRVADLVTALDDTKQQLRLDLADVDAAAAPAARPDPSFLGPERDLDCGGVLLHLFEELSQHLGQLEVMRDVLLAASAPSPASAFEPPLSWLRGKQGVKWRRPGAGLLPSWVADMDFPVAPAIRSALVNTIDRGDLGYPDWFADELHPLAEPFAARMAQRFGWEADPSHVRGLTDVISGLQIVVDLATSPGDAVVLQEPNYRPFRTTLPAMGRCAVRLALVPDGASWRHDLERLERDLADAGDAKLLLLVNPHNPTGRAFKREELEAVAELAARHDLLVVSDEIHSDLTYAPYRHIPFAALGPEVAARTVTLTSATKAFNLAGLRTAIAHVGPKWLRRRWDAEPPDIHGVAGVLGVEATVAAWRDGDAWLSGLREHLHAQRDRLSTALAGVGGVNFRVPDATYLTWLDWTAADLGEDAAEFFRREARVYASPGPDYGGGPSWLRLNIATSTAVLDTVVARMLNALERH